MGRYVYFWEGNMKADVDEISVITSKTMMVVASHGYRWIDYQYVGETVEREHIQKAVTITTDVCGTRPVGIYQGKPNVNTRRLIVEEGGFLYDSDCYSDDLPFWNTDYGRPHLVIPYTLDVNDMRFATPQGFNCGDQFFTYLKVTLVDRVNY